MLQQLPYRAAAWLERPTVRLLRLAPRHPPLFIVGVPRSGTTVVYLHLFNTFDFAYFPNIAKRHRLAPLTYTLLGKTLSSYRPTYRSEYGIVEGPMAPSDGWAVFHRWFPADDRLAPVETGRLYELRNIVAGLERVFSAPFINKNNSNSLRIRHLSQLFPDSRFVWVRRETVPTVLSLLEARRAHRIPPGRWWGAPPPQFHDEEFISEVDLVTHQVVGLNDFIGKELQRIERGRWLELDYDQFCRAPARVLSWTEESYARAGVELERRETVEIGRSFNSRSRSEGVHSEAAGEIGWRAEFVLRRLRGA